MRLLDATYMLQAGFVSANCSHKLFTPVLHSSAVIKDQFMLSYRQAVSSVSFSHKESLDSSVVWT